MSVKIIFKKSDRILQRTFWNSPEAKAWFGCKNENEIVEHAMFNRIKLLKQAYKTAYAWKNVVSDNDQKNMCTNYDFHALEESNVFMHRSESSIG